MYVSHEIHNNNYVPTRTEANKLPDVWKILQEKQYPKCIVTLIRLGVGSKKKPGKLSTFCG